MKKIILIIITLITITFISCSSMKSKNGYVSVKVEVFYDNGNTSIEDISIPEKSILSIRTVDGKSWLIYNKNECDSCIPTIVLYNVINYNIL